MKPLSASAAAKAVGKSVPTITRAIKSGRLSATKLDGGGYEIDPAELFRVWPAVTRNPDTQRNMLDDVTPNETRALEVELKAKDQEIALLRSQLDDTRQDRDEWRKQAQQLALVDHSQENARAAAEKPAEGDTAHVGWFDRLLGRKPIRGA